MTVSEFGVTGEIAETLHSTKHKMFEQNSTQACVLQPNELESTIAKECRSKNLSTGNLFSKPNAGLSAGTRSSAAQRRTHIFARTIVNGNCGTPHTTQEQSPTLQRKMDENSYESVKTKKACSSLLIEGSRVPQKPHFTASYCRLPMEEIGIYQAEHDLLVNLRIQNFENRKTHEALNSQRKQFYVAIVFTVLPIVLMLVLASVFKLSDFENNSDYSSEGLSVDEVDAIFKERHSAFSTLRVVCLRCSNVVKIFGDEGFPPDVNRIGSLCCMKDVARVVGRVTQVRFWCPKLFHAFEDIVMRTNLSKL